MTYETNLAKLARLTPDEWDDLLRSTWSAPCPRRIVRIQGAKVARKTVKAPEGRREYALQQVASGRKKIDVANELGVSACLFSKILNGSRN